MTLLEIESHTIRYKVPYLMLCRRRTCKRTL